MFKVADLKRATLMKNSIPLQVLIDWFQHSCKTFLYNTSQWLPMCDA